MAHRSPSSRRAWVEMSSHQHGERFRASPSSRRAWVEIRSRTSPTLRQFWSPSSRRAWVEIERCKRLSGLVTVALLTEGVGRNCGFEVLCSNLIVALLAEGVGRNLKRVRKAEQDAASPSSRRAWVEIWCPPFCPAGRPVALLAEGVGRNPASVTAFFWAARRPPRGGRG